MSLQFVISSSVVLVVFDERLTLSVCSSVHTRAFIGNMLIKPVHTVFKVGWMDLRTTPFCILQKKTGASLSCNSPPPPLLFGFFCVFFTPGFRTTDGPAGPTLRILTKVPCAIIATANTQGLPSFPTFSHPRCVSQLSRCRGD